MGNQPLKHISFDCILIWCTHPLLGLVQAVLSTDPFMAEASAIHFVNIADDVADQKDKVVRKLSGPKGRITRVVWTDLNRVVISASEDGFVRRWDVEVRTSGCTCQFCMALHCHPLYLRWHHHCLQGWLRASLSPDLKAAQGMQRCSLLQPKPPPCFGVAPELSLRMVSGGGGA